MEVMSQMDIVLGVGYITEVESSDIKILCDKVSGLHIYFIRSDTNSTLTSNLNKNERYFL